MTLSQINVYRMVHIENMPHILRHGITHKDSVRANPNFITIGDTSLIDTRSRKVVNVDNGVLFALDCQQITLGNYIPFYFGVRMPMLYVMQSGGNFVRQATSAENIVYIACSLDRIIQTNIIYFFSDGHGTDGLTTFYDRSKIQALPTLIDWESVKSSYWGGQENLNIKRKKQAEFLVSSDLPSNVIVGVGCYNETAKRKLQSFGIQEHIIKIIPTAYF